MNTLFQRLFRLSSPASESPLLPILESYIWCVPVVAALGFLTSVLEGIGISLLIPLLTTLSAKENLTSDGIFLANLTRFAEIFHPEYRLIAISLIILGLVALKAALQAVNWTFISWIDGRAGDDIRRALSRQLLQFGYAFYLGHEPARLVTIVSTEAWRASEGIRIVFSIAASSAALIVFGVLLAIVNWKLFIFVAAGVLLIRFAQSLYSQRLQRLSEGVAQANRALAERMLLIIEAMRLIRIFGQEKHEQQRFGLASGGVRKALYAIERASARVYPTLEVLHSALFISVLFVANAMGMDIATILTFLVLLYRMQPHLLALSQGRLSLAAIQGSVREVEWLLDPKGKPATPAGGIPFTGLKGTVTFEKVKFSYPNRSEAEPPLSDVSFTIHAGRATALIGRSGTGKTTIVNILCRLLDPTAGRITVNGIDLTEIDPVTWRKRIGIAGQDIELVDGSIAENIAYGTPDASLDDVVAAARLSDADPFICALSDGYDTHIGSRGLNLSGGQRQRLGLARALVRKPEILILDEATNAVDGISEMAIMAVLQDRSRYNTAVVISHRKSTLVCCQDGIVLEGGRVIEAGPLRDLDFYKSMALGAEE